MLLVLIVQWNKIIPLLNEMLGSKLILFRVSIHFKSLIIDVFVWWFEENGP